MYFTKFSVIGTFGLVCFLWNKTYPSQFSKIYHLINLHCLSLPCKFFEPKRDFHEWRGQGPDYKESILSIDSKPTCGRRVPPFVCHQLKQYSSPWFTIIELSTDQNVLNPLSCKQAANRYTDMLIQ
jgi:hypothetical protein